MSYTPSSHAVVNKALGPGQATPTDARSMYYDTTNFLYRPYQSLSEANTYLSLSKYRAGRFPLFMNLTGTLNGDGTFTGGAVTEYWYKDGVGNGDLIEKTSGGGGSAAGYGEYYASWDNLQDLPDATSNINTLFATSTVNTIIIDVPIVIDGSVVGSGKRIKFITEGYISGTGTIDEVEFDIPKNQDALAITLDFTNMSTSTGSICIKNFGAKTSLSNNQPNIQKTVDVALANNIGVLEIGQGNFTITKGIFFGIDRNSDGQYDFWTMKILGDKHATGSQGSIGCESTIILNSLTDFCFNIQNGKGVEIYGIAFFGQNYAPYAVNNFTVADSGTSWVSAGVRDVRQSPHCGIVIDGISRAYLGGDAWKYPNWISSYTETIDNGSTDVTIDHCAFFQFVVGICNSPTGIKQNAEAMNFQNSWFSCCKSAISNGQSQARSVFIRNVKMWSGIHTAFDCLYYSNNQSSGVYVDGANLAGCVKYLCGTADFGIGYLNEFKNIHAESIYAIGGGTDGYSTGGRIKLQNCQIDLNGENQYYSHRANVIVKCKQFVLDHCIVNYYASQDPVYLYVDCALTVVMGGSDTEIVTFAGTINLENRVIYMPSYGVGNFGNNYYLEGDTSIYGSIFLKYGDTVHKALTNGTSQYKYGQRATFRGGSWVSHQFNVTSVQSITGTTGVLNINHAHINTIPLGAPLTGDFYDDLGTIGQGSFGVVSSIDYANFRITVTFMNRAIDMSFTGNVRCTIQNAVTEYPYFQIGDIASGSNVITNVIGEKSQITVAVNKYFIHPAFPDGTWVVSKTSSTITLSQNATYSQTNAFIMNDVNWETVGIGGKPMTTAADSWNRLAWKRGDMILNMVSDNNGTYDNTKSHWVCIQDGMMTESGREPVFKYVAAT